MLHHEEDGLWGFILWTCFYLLSSLLLFFSFILLYSDSGELHVLEKYLEQCHYFYL